MKYRDYYKTLGVKRDADAATIKKAYRKLAREFHPDVNKGADAEARFKEVSEAYEVLGDEEKRRRYDALGSNWKANQDFTPPPGWEGIRFETGGAGPEGFGGFSDFFDLFFGQGFADGFPGGGRTQGRSFRTRTRTGARAQRPARGGDVEAELEVTLEEAFHGTRKSLRLQTPEGPRSYEVRIPAGVKEGSRIRLSGQGGSGHGGGPGGDLFLMVRLQPHPLFSVVADHDLETTISVSPWEAALGATVEVQTLGGPASLKLAPGSQSGQRLRLRGKGLPKGRGEFGDLFVRIRIVVPQQLSEREQQLFEQLREESAFRPRG